MAAQHLPIREIPAVVDRSMGDVHPEGDPHIHLDPDRLPVVVDALADRLVALAPSDENAIRLRQRQWQVRWKLDTARWRQAADNLGGLSVAVQHSTFGYLLRWLSVESAIDLEPKPGLPPSASHLSDVLSDPALARVKLILIATYQDERPARWLANQTQLPIEVLPGTVNDQPETDSLAELIDHLIDRLAHHQKAADHG